MPTDLPEKKKPSRTRKAALYVLALIANGGVWAGLTAAFAVAFMMVFAMMNDYIPWIPAYGFMACWSFTWFVLAVVVMVDHFVDLLKRGDD